MSSDRTIQVSRAEKVRKWEAARMIAVFADAIGMTSQIACDGWVIMTAPPGTRINNLIKSYEEAYPEWADSDIVLDRRSEPRPFQNSDLQWIAEDLDEFLAKRPGKPRKSRVASQSCVA